MKRITSVAELRDELDRHKDKSTGLVPTMGSLHEGHISLVKRSLNENDITVVSIFVNPAQFNNPDDLEKYPRNISTDLDILSGILCSDDIVFIPLASDIYSNEEMPRVDLGHLDRVMEGEHRPGHFMGVVRIVKILFDLCRPRRAYFGRKDFQQLAVIKSMLRQTGMETEIRDCPVVREPNGLAMSSRNERLPAAVREKAGIIYRVLMKYHEQQEPVDISKLKNDIASEISAGGPFIVEYFEIVDDDELKALKSVNDIRGDKTYTGCIAVHAGDVRLIDNTRFFFPFAKG